MAQYTNQEVVTLNGGTLAGPETVANINFTGEDAYARALTVSNTAVGTVNVSSGGTMYMRGDNATAENINVYGYYALPAGVNYASGGRLWMSGGVINTLTLDNEGTCSMYGGTINNLILSKTGTSVKSSVKLYIYGGTVLGGSNGGAGGAKEIYANGGVVSNFIANGGAYIFVSKNATFKGGTFNGARLAIRGGTVSSMTILNAKDESHHRLSAGIMSSCTIVAGASYTAIGGTAIDTVVSGANARFRLSGAQAVFEKGTIVSGGSLLVSIGKASGTTVGSSGWLLVSGQNAIGENIVQSGQSANAAVSAGGAITNVTINDSAHLGVYGGTVNGAKILTSAMMTVRNGGSLNDVVVSGASARFVVSNGGVVNRPVINEFLAWGYASDGAVINDAEVCNGGRLLIYSGGTALNPSVSQLIAPPTGTSMARLEISSGGFVSGGYAGHDNGRTIEVYLRPGGNIKGMTFGSGAFVLCAGTAEDCVVSNVGGQVVTVRQGGLFKNGVVLDSGKITISKGTVSGTVVKSGGQIYNVHVNGQSVEGLVKDVTIERGGYVTLRNNQSGGALGQMSGGVVKTGGYLYASNGGVAHDVLVEKEGQAYSYNGGNFSGGMIYGNLRVTNGGKTSGALIQSGGVHHVSMGGSALDTVISEGGVMRISSGAAIRVNVLSGGSLLLNAQAPALVDPTVADGAYVSARIGSGSTVDRTEAVMTDATNFNGTVTVEVANKTQTIAIVAEGGAGNANLKVAVPWLMFEDVVTAGNTYVNPFLASRGKFTLSADGKTLNTAAVAVTNVTEAKGLYLNGDVVGTKFGSTLNANDRAAIWNGNKIAGGINVSVALAEGAGADCGDLWMTTANALKINKALFGTVEDQNFAHDVNYYFQGGTEVRNLAAGANYGGSVKGVNVYATDSAKFTGVAYMGGFGTVTEDVYVQISAAGTEFTKDLYVGALYNAGKVDAGTTTSVDGITLSLSNGTFDGNIYGASAVKAGAITTTAATAPLHTVGDVTLTINNGTSTKGYDSCIFAGGYATGHDTAKLAPVYTVDSVTLKIAGGSWGTAKGGRGVFGGAFASDNIGTDGVYAQVGDVDITISGGTFGNVYGGGWAQKGAKSEVGNVSISISGGTIANVFGGGSTSSSGGSTVAGDVTITVSGGSITGDIYARGQNATDSVGAAAVTFTGSTAYGCGVHGYSYVGDEDPSAATLSFTSYTGTFTGKLDGFATVTFDGDSTATFGAAADIDNDAWEFDLANRWDAKSQVSLLTWSGTENFSDDKVKVNFADADQAAAGWSIATADFTGATFDLYLNGVEAVADIAYDTAIEGGDWDGWKFTSVDGTLKFAKLA
jgi:autotransporter passenger strand-loop-strand repeat protein